MIETAHTKTDRPEPVSRTSTQHALRQARDRRARQPRHAALPALGQPETQEQQKEELASVHPVLFLVVLGTTVWFLASISLTFAWDRESSFAVAVVFAVSFISFLVVLLTASLTAADPRWRARHVTFVRYLRGRAGIATGSIRGWEAAIQILTVPVSLALAMTAIGLVWTLVQ